MLTADEIQTTAVADLARLIDRSRSVVALTGAGLSTDSGIPDYRGPDTPPHTPMTYQLFISGPAAQQRYWARSHLGWRRMDQADPNDGHRALAALEQAGLLTGLITQNVDGLHERAGSVEVVDLHGRIDEVVCLDCGQVTSRARLHARLDQLNPDIGDVPVVALPDGDVEFSDTESFRIAECENCGGVLKPHVVFFGENVPRDRVDRCYAWVESAGALLVAGSSLTVQSGLRFVRKAHQRGIPVGIINRGVTRGDPFATIRVDAGCSPVLQAVAAELGAV